MRMSLGGDEDQGAELPTVVRDRRRRARCVPDQPVNTGNVRSLSDNPVHRLTAQRQESRAEMDEHPGLMVPGEDPVWGELGDAAPNSRTSGPDAILQPPRPEIIPSARLLQLAAEHDTEPDREAAN